MKDINKNANGKAEKWEAIPVNGQAKKVEAIDPADPIYPIGTGGEAQMINPIRNADGGGFKGKFFAKTNNLGITEDNKLTKTFAWGTVAGLLLVVGLKYAHKKGYLKKMSFLGKI